MVRDCLKEKDSFGPVGKRKKKQTGNNLEEESKEICKTRNLQCMRAKKMAGISE